MLSKINRLTKKKDFNYVFNGGKGVGEGFLVLKVASNNLNNSRFGFIVGKNFSKSAVVRNKVKRRLREIIRPRLGVLKNGLDIVFIVRPNFGRKTFIETSKTVDILLKKANCLNNG